MEANAYSGGGRVRGLFHFLHSHYMATCLMDTGQFHNHYIKQINGYRWAVEELIKYTYQPLSLHKSKESKERNVIKSQ